MASNAKVKYILELENKLQLDGIVKKVTEAANDFDGLKAKIETSARSLGLMQRELATMQGTFAANNARIKELQQALNLASVSATQDEKANAKLRAELDRLTATNAKLSTSMERKSISIQRVSANLAELGRQANGTSQSLQQTAVNIDKNTGATTGLIGGITKLAAGYASLAAVGQVVQWAKEGAAIEQVEAAFANLAKKSGTSADQYLAALKKASAGTISEADLMIGANKAVLLAGDRLAKDVPQLLEIARAASKATGEDINFMFDSLVTGLARNSKMIIDNLGITVDVAKANEIYARSIGKTADALTEQERAMAFQADVMRQGKQMIDDVGAASDTNADKIARANAKWTNFKNDLKQGAAVAVAFVADSSEIDAEVQRIGALNQQILTLNQSVISGTTPWTAYAAEMTKLGAVSATLSPYQIAIAQSLAETGMSAETAAQAVQGTNIALINEAAAAGMSAEAIAQVISQSQQVAAISPEAAGTVAELTQSFMDGTISGTDYALAMSELTAETETSAAVQAIMAEQVAYLTSVQEYQTMVTLGQADANLILSDTQYENLQLSAQAQLEAESERQQHELLTDAVLGVADGKYSLGDASIDLSNKLGITKDKAVDLINTFTHLFMVLAQGKGASFIKGMDLAGLGQKAIDEMIRDVENAGRDVGKSVGRSVGAGGRMAGRPDIYGPKKKKGGAGKKGGKSEEVKAAEKEQKDLAKAEKSIEQARANHNKKLEDLDRKHSAELIKINAKYIQDALAAEQKFNTDKFAIRNGFKQGLFDIDRDLYDAARAEEVKYWDESQAIAQAGDATKAAELYAAGQELAQMRADHAQELRDIDQQIAEAANADEAARLADRKQRMEEAYAEEQRLAEENISKIRSGEDTLKSERDDAIREENDDYAKARSEAEQQFADSLQKIIDGYDAVDEATNRTKDAIINMVNTLVPEFARLAQAAAVPTPPTSVDASVTGRATGGTVNRGQAYRVGEFGSELFIPNVSGTILNQRQIDRAMNRTTNVPTIATPRSTTSRSETINRNEIVLNVSGTAREIVQAESAIERIAQRVYNRNQKITVNRVITKKPR